MSCNTLRTVGIIQMLISRSTAGSQEAPQHRAQTPGCHRYWILLDCSCGSGSHCLAPFSWQTPWCVGTTHRHQVPIYEHDIEMGWSERGKTELEPVAYRLFSVKDKQLCSYCAFQASYIHSLTHTHRLQPLQHADTGIRGSNLQSSDWTALPPEPKPSGNVSHAAAHIFWCLKNWEGGENRLCMIQLSVLSLSL